MVVFQTEAATGTGRARARTAPELPRMSSWSTVLKREVTPPTRKVRVMPVFLHRASGPRTLERVTENPWSGRSSISIFSELSEWSVNEMTGLEGYCDTSSPDCATSGDIILFSGTHSMFWNEQKDNKNIVFEDSHHSLGSLIMDAPFHAGVVIVRDGKVMLLHSTLAHPEKPGVHMTELKPEVERRLANGQLVEVRRLRLPAGVGLDREVSEYVDQVIGLPYTHPIYANRVHTIFKDNLRLVLSGKPGDIVRSGLTRPRAEIPAFPRWGLCCAELVASLYERLRLHPEIENGRIRGVQVSPSNIANFPRDLAHGAILEEPVLLGEPTRVPVQEMSDKVQDVVCLLKSFRERDMLERSATV